MPPKKTTLSPKEQAVISSALPALRVNETFATTRPSEFGYALELDQVAEWSSFETEVRRETKRLGFKDPGPTILSVPREYHLVGNELGLQSRFIQHVYQQMGAIFASLKLGVRHADSPCGTRRVTIHPTTDVGSLNPDLILATTSGLHEIRAVGEVKTFWTFKNKDVPMTDFLAVKFGQIAVYMDRFHCRYGFYTTYNDTWFIQRVDTNFFLYSPAVSRKQNATADKISVREAFLYLAARADDPVNSLYVSGKGGALRVKERRAKKKSLKRPAGEIEEDDPNSDCEEAARPTKIGKPRK